MAWTRMRYKNGKVWIETDDAGNILVSRGLVKARYKQDDTREYSFKADQIRTLEEETPERAQREGSPEPASRPTKQRSAPSGAPPKKGGSKGSAKRVGALNSESPISDIEPASEEYIEIYTDGATSGNPGPSGLGVILRWGPYHREIYQFLGQGTNNIAELTAIKVGLEAVKKRDMPVRIFTDSQYSIGVLTGAYKAKSNRQLIMEIQALMATFPDLKLEKVRGHSGNPLNERADELARKAVKESSSSS